MASVTRRVRMRWVELLPLSLTHSPACTHTMIFAIILMIPGCVHFEEKLQTVSEGSI